MKICPKCGASNKDKAVMCSECYTSLNKSETLSDEKTRQHAEEFFRQEEKKDKIKHIISLAVLPLFSVIYIPFAAVCIYKIREAEVFFTLLVLYFVAVISYYLGFFKPEALFRLNHMFTIDNLDDVELSSWHYFTEKVGAIFVLLFALFMVIYLCCSTLPSPTNAIVVHIG